MSPRYAIYYAPAADTPLWRKASAWLGRDAYSGQNLVRAAPTGLKNLDLDALTADPRVYGFHATLKAPFELHPDRTEAELLAFAARFCAARAPFTASIAPAALGRFLAFRLTASTPQMDALHVACVREFDAFRAPLSDFDLARRRKAPLTPEQDARLVQWGYPYIFDDFRFHMTLTGQIRDEAERMNVLSALQAHFAAESGPHHFDGVAVFKQDARDAPFEVLARVGFAQTVEAAQPASF